MNQEGPVHVSEPVEAVLAVLDYIDLLRKSKSALDRLLKTHSCEELITIVRFELRSTLRRANPPRAGIHSPGNLPQDRFDQTADWIASEAVKREYAGQQMFEFAK